MKRPIPEPGSDVQGIMRNELCDIIDMHINKNTTDTASYRDAVLQLGKYLHNHRDDDGSIVLQGQWALYYECTGEWKKAAERREREVQYLFSLFRVGGAIADVDAIYMIRRLEALKRDLVNDNNPTRADYVSAMLEVLKMASVQEDINKGRNVPGWIGTE